MSIAASRVPGFWSALFLILCVYVVFAPGTVAGIDPNARWDTARALWSRGTLSIGERTEEASLIKRFGYTVHPSRRGAFMHFGLGQSLLMIPFDIPVVAMAPFLYPAEPRFAEKLLMSLTFFPFVSALACALLYGLLRELNTPWRPALATTALASFATALLPYSQIHQEEPLLACCPLAACWLLPAAGDILSGRLRVAVSAVSAFGAVIRLSFGVGFVALAVFTLAAASRARDRALLPPGRWSLCDCRRRIVRLVADLQHDPIRSAVRNGIRPLRQTFGRLAHAKRCGRDSRAVARAW